MAHYLIIASVKDEILPLLKYIESPVKTTIAKREIISGNINNIKVKILITGPGLVNCAHSLTAVIETRKPSLIIQTGCAGAFKKFGLKIGDIGIATQETDIHLGIEPDNPNLPLSPLPFSIISKNNLDLMATYPLDRNLSDCAYKTLSSYFQNQDINVFQGNFITVSTVTSSDKRANKLFKWFNPCMESMEGSGAAHIALHYDIPFTEIRAASNFVGKRDLSKWNLSFAFQICSQSTYIFVKNNNIINY